MNKLFMFLVYIKYLFYKLKNKKKINYQNSYLLYFICIKLFYKIYYNEDNDIYILNIMIKDLQYYVLKCVWYIWIIGRWDFGFCFYKENFYKSVFIYLKDRNKNFFLDNVLFMV